jgi:hypothetical protein
MPIMFCVVQIPKNGKYVHFFLEAAGGRPRMLPAIKSLVFNGFVKTSNLEQKPVGLANDMLA